MTAASVVAQEQPIHAEKPGISSVPGRAPAAVARKRRTPALLASLVTLAVVGAGGWHWLTLGIEDTDDAQVEGRVMEISARVSGQVATVRVEDDQHVEAGDVLVELDPADFAARVESAKADLAAARAAAEGARSQLALTEKTAPADLVQAQGGMSAATSTVSGARAAVDQAEADVSAAEARRSLADANLQRSDALFRDNAVPKAEVDGRQAEFDGADAALRLARARLIASQAAVDGSGGGVVLARGRLSAASATDEHLAVARAAVALADARAEQSEAALKLAELNLSYATVRAPRAGIVSRRSVEQGKLVSPDRPLLAIVATDDTWVVANFKEDQIGEMRAGQPARVRIDAYGRREFTGHLESISGGTGSRFALLPPDNATGNFVKVVQRVPARIRLDAASGVDLRPGMSADVSIQTRMGVLR